MNRQSNPVTRTAGALLTTLLVLAGAGCTQSLALKPDVDVPVPLARQLPLKVGVYYPDAFRSYVYEENTDERPNWHIDCGPSQVVLFDHVLPSLFAEVDHLDAAAAPGDAALDAILVPQVDEMQFALPHETRTDLYEAWIRYTITLYAPDGSEIAAFPLTGYGKSTTSLFTGEDDGLTSAINSAMRDVGAKLTLGFPRNQAVQPWLAAKRAEWNGRSSVMTR